MGRIYAIAINTFREAVRDKVLYGVLFFACAVLLFTLALGELSLDQQARVIYDIGMASISLFSMVIAIFLGSSLLYKEIERKTLYVILPKPIHRYEFLLGKYFGITLTGMVFIGVMGAIQLTVMGVQAGASLTRVSLVAAAVAALLLLALWKARDRTVVLLPASLVALSAGAWLASSAGVDLPPAIASLILAGGELLILAAVALLFSSFSTPFLTGAFTFGVWLLGRSADDMLLMQSRVITPAIKTMLRMAAEVVPNLNLFVPGRSTLAEQSVNFGGPWAYVASSMGYALLQSALILALAAFIFRRRDFL